MAHRVMVVLIGLALSSHALADVVLLAADAGKNGHAVKLGDKAQRTAQAKEAPPRAPRTGEIALVDSSGVEFFINTDITFSTSSSASAAASEASYTGAVNATTSGGGVVSETLNDAFDGYNSLCLSFDGGPGPCTTGGGGKRGGGTYTVYNQNGPAALDASCGDRQVILPPQDINGVSVQRKVFVPSNDEFARWVNIFTNTTAGPLSFNALTSNNLGSDANTILVTTSSGDATATAADYWATSFQNFSGTTSTDVRLGHVFGGSGAPTPMSGITFVNGDDNPYWSYTMTLAPGETQIIVNFVTGQESRADAALKAAELVNFTGNASACMSSTELDQVSNFLLGPAPVVLTPDRPIPATDRSILAALAGLLVTLGALALRARRV